MYDTGKLVFIEGSAQVVRKLTDGEEKLIELVTDIPPVYLAEFAFDGTTF